MKYIPVRRTVLADILDHIREDLAARVPPEEMYNLRNTCASE